MIHIIIQIFLNYFEFLVIANGKICSVLSIVVLKTKKDLFCYIHTVLCRKTFTRLECVINYKINSYI